MFRTVLLAAVTVLCLSAPASSQELSYSFPVGDTVAYEVEERGDTEGVGKSELSLVGTFRLSGVAGSRVRLLWTALQLREELSSGVVRQPPGANVTGRPILLSVTDRGQTAVESDLELPEIFQTFRVDRDFDRWLIEFPAKLTGQAGAVVIDTVYEDQSADWDEVWQESIRRFEVIGDTTVRGRSGLLVRYDTESRFELLSRPNSETEVVVEGTGTARGRVVFDPRRGVLVVHEVTSEFEGQQTYDGVVEHRSRGRVPVETETDVQGTEERTLRLIEGR